MMGKVVELGFADSKPWQSPQMMKHISQHYPCADVIRMVLDNLNIHKMGSLYAATPSEEARATANIPEFRYTPRHGSWLDIAEVGFAVLSNMCLSQRIQNEAVPERKITANIAEHNARAQPVKWKFTAKDARGKLQQLYPAISTRLSTRPK